MTGKKILSTKSTPEIILNQVGIITIKGRSLNGDINEIGTQIEEWIDKYCDNPADVTLVEFYLEYFNKSNAKIFVSMLKKIESLSLKNKKYVINWYYEEGDDDIFEKGEFFSSELQIPFNFIEICDTLIPKYLPSDTDILT